MSYGTYSGPCDNNTKNEETINNCCLSLKWPSNKKGQKHQPMSCYENSTICEFKKNFFWSQFLPLQQVNRYYHITYYMTLINCNIRFMCRSTMWYKCWGMHKKDISIKSKFGQVHALDVESCNNKIEIDRIIHYSSTQDQQTGGATSTHSHSHSHKSFETSQNTNVHISVLIEISKSVCCGYSQ